MNRKMVFYTVARIIKIEALFMLLPAIVSLIYKETRIFETYLLVSIGAYAFGWALSLVARPKNRVIYAKEGFVIVSVAWIFLSAIGALPFVISGEIPSFVNAFFETVSGFTTTGASILENVELLSYGNLFWRSFTHWIGGMGFLVFVIAVTNNVSDRSIHILRAEVPGPVMGKLVPKLAQTAKILYLIYIAMTLIEIVMLFFGGMPLFESIVHSFGTAGTGGFGIKADSITSYSPYCQWVIAVFMLLFGINFNIHYLMLIRRFKSVFKSAELWGYLFIVLLSTTLIAFNINSSLPSVGETIRTSFFQVSSIITTTGYATVDFNGWPDFSKAILLLLMLIGACAGSTGGGLKVSRFLLLVKIMKRQMGKLLHPRMVKTIRLEGKPVDEETLDSVTVYFGIFMMCIFAIFLLISFEPFGMESNFSATVACFNNVGPGFGAVGPAANYAIYTDFSKVILSIAMLLGRLEIYPILICLSPSTWIKK